MENKEQPTQTLILNSVQADRLNEYIESQMFRILTDIDTENIGLRPFGLLNKIHSKMNIGRKLDTACLYSGIPYKVAIVETTFEITEEEERAIIGMTSHLDFNFEIGNRIQDAIDNIKYRKDVADKKDRFLSRLKDFLS